MEACHRLSPHLMASLAIATNDFGIVKTYGRFLGPIMERLPQETRSVRGASILNAAFKHYIEQAAGCSK